MTRPPSAPHGDGPARRRPGRAGHVPLPSPSEGCSEPAAAGAAGPAGPRARSTVERAGLGRAREEERRVAARAPGRRSPAATPRARGERTGSGPTGPGCVAAGRAQGRGPPAAAPRTRGAERRRAGPRAGPKRPDGHEGLALQGSVQRAQQNNRVGQGC